MTTIIKVRDLDTDGNGFDIDTWLSVKSKEKTLTAENIDYVREGVAKYVEEEDMPCETDEIVSVVIDLLKEQGFEAEELYPEFEIEW